MLKSVKHTISQVGNYYCSLDRYPCFSSWTGLAFSLLCYQVHAIHAFASKYILHVFIMNVQNKDILRAIIHKTFEEISIPQLSCVDFQPI